MIKPLRLACACFAGALAAVGFHGYGGAAAQGQSGPRVQSQVARGVQYAIGDLAADDTPRPQTK